MALIVKNGEDFERAPEGNHVAVCYMVIDLGIQTTNWMGDTKQVHKIRIGWELCEETMNDGRPFAVFKEYTASLSEKANLRKDLQSWRGRAFTGEELSGFDVFAVLGVPCMINVVHNKSESTGNIYANVASIAPLPKSMAKPQRHNPLVKFSLEEFDQKIFNELPEWLQEKINTRGVSQEPENTEQIPVDAYNDYVPF